MPPFLKRLRCNLELIYAITLSVLLHLLLFVIDASNSQVGIQTHQSSIAVSMNYQNTDKSSQKSSITSPVKSLKSPIKKTKPPEKTALKKAKPKKIEKKKALKKLKAPTPKAKPTKAISATSDKKISKKKVKDVVITTNKQSIETVPSKKQLKKEKKPKKEISNNEVVAQKVTQTESMNENQATPTNSLIVTPQPPRYELGSAENPKPSAPALAKKMGWEGDVIIGVYLAADGTIEQMEFVKSTHYGVLNYEAWETVRNQWTFKPSEHSNPTQSEYIEIPISFRLGKAKL